MNEQRFILGVDVGGTRTKFGLVNCASGELAAMSVRATQFSGTDEFFKVLDQAATGLLQQCQADRSAMTAIGIGLPGFVDGDFISQVWESLAFMEGTQFRPALEQAFRLPVPIENDARAIALAEYTYGCHGKPERLLSLTLGTGLGFGYLIAGAPHEKRPLSHKFLPAGSLAISMAGEESGSPFLFRTSVL